jgi:hypothetical protein
MVLEGGEGNSAFIIGGNGTREGESKLLIGRGMVLGKGNLFCTYSYVGNDTKGEISTKFSGERKSALAMGEKKVLERGNLSISGKRIMLGRGESAPLSRKRY